MKHALSTAVLLTALLAGALPVPAAPDARLDPRLAKSLVRLEVRAADLDEVIRQLSGAMAVELQADASLSGRRVTLYAEKISLFSIQAASAALFQGSWKTDGTGDDASYTLTASADFDRTVERLRAQRRAVMVRRVTEIATSLRSRSPAAVAAELRAQVARRRPRLPEESLQLIDAGFARQFLPARPLLLGIDKVLITHGAAWIPFSRLPAATRAELSLVYADSRSRTAMRDPSTSAPGPTAGPSAAEVLAAPQARLEYRFIYGDRWTGPLLLIRLGAGDHWATFTIPSSLFELPGYASLYPQSARNPAALEQKQPLDLKVNTDEMTWDQAVTAVAKAAHINVLTDSYLRPAVFPPPTPGPVLSSPSLKELLDKICEHYGYIWWRLGDIYLFRHRYFPEEQRVSVPEALGQVLGATASRGKLGPRGIVSLASLTDEQLLTAHLYASAGGRNRAPGAAFDLNEMQTARAALALMSRLDESQATAAADQGLGVTAAAPDFQTLFANIGDDRGFPFDTDEAEFWRFRVAEAHTLDTTGIGRAMAGQVTFTLDYASAGTRTVRLALRFPAPPAPRREPEAPASPAKP